MANYTNIKTPFNDQDGYTSVCGAISEVADTAFRYIGGERLGSLASEDQVIEDLLDDLLVRTQMTRKEMIVQLLLDVAVLEGHERIQGLRGDLMSRLSGFLNRPNDEETAADAAQAAMDSLAQSLSDAGIHAHIVRL